MTHSRKDYQALAAVIRGQLEAAAGDNQYHTTVHAVLHHTAREIADYYERENTRFNRDRFYKACGFSHDHDKGQS